MKKIALTEIRRLEVIEGTEPAIINDDDVLLKVEAVGVCGSDIHYYKEGKIGDQIVEFPFTIGHEFVAHVAKTGANVTRIKMGDLVAVDPLVSCQSCSQCKHCRFHTCLNQRSIGCPGQLEGCLSEFIIVPERNCFFIPENVPLEIAALVEPLSIGYYAAELHKKYLGIKRVAILGVGPIGTSVMLFLRSFGIDDIFVSDKLDYRLEISGKHGASFTANPNKVNIPNYMSKMCTISIHARIPSITAYGFVLAIA